MLCRCHCVCMCLRMPVSHLLHSIDEFFVKQYDARGGDDEDSMQHDGGGLPAIPWPAQSVSARSSVLRFSVVLLFSEQRCVL
jgi:hypothetical protein